LSGQDTSVPFLLAWQGGFIYHISKNVSLKAAVTLYNYDGSGRTTPPRYRRRAAWTARVADGARILRYFRWRRRRRPSWRGRRAEPKRRRLAVTANNDGFIFNQTGLDYLQVLDIPFELDFKIGRLPARFFGDFARTWKGAAGGSGGAVYNAALPGSKFAAQRYDNTAYQFGFGISSADDLGMVYGSAVKKNTWDAASIGSMWSNTPWTQPAGFRFL